MEIRTPRDLHLLAIMFPFQTICITRSSTWFAIGFQAVGMKLMSADDYQRLMLVKMVSGVRLPTGRMMSQGEIKALVDACLNDTIKVKKGENNLPKQSPAAYRDLAIFGLMYIGGLRRSEVADLNAEDIDLELKEARVIGKGNKERMLFLDDGTVTAVEQWLAFRGDHEGALFYRVLNACTGLVMHHCNSLDSFLKSFSYSIKIDGCTPFIFQLHCISMTFPDVAQSFSELTVLDGDNGIILSDQVPYSSFHTGCA